MGIVVHCFGNLTLQVLVFLKERIKSMHVFPPHNSFSTPPQPPSQPHPNSSLSSHNLAHCANCGHTTCEHIKSWLCKHQTRNLSPFGSPFRLHNYSRTNTTPNPTSQSYLLNQQNQVRPKENHPTFGKVWETSSQRVIWQCQSQSWREEEGDANHHYHDRVSLNNNWP